MTMTTREAAPVQRYHGNGFAVASLVTGICSVLFFWAGLMALALATCAITFGGVGWHHTRDGADKRGMAIAGLILGIVGAVAYLAFGIASHGVGLLI